ncbi:MAG: PolC-type DNA polymerase III [Erysipelotrichaceae bacterium]
MDKSLYELLIGYEELGLYDKWLQGCFIQHITYQKSVKRVILTLTSFDILPFQLYESLTAFLSAKLFSSVTLIVNADKSQSNISNYMLYFLYFVKSNQLQTIFEECLPEIKDEAIFLKFNEQEAMDQAAAYLSMIKDEMASFGFKNDYNLALREKGVEIAPKLEMPKKPKEEKVMQKVQKEKDNGYFRKKKEDRYALVCIQDMKEVCEEVKFEGKVFKIDNRVTRTGKIIQTILIVDDKDALKAKRFENKSNTKEVLESLKTGSYWMFFGSYLFDTFTNDYVFQIDSMQEVDSKDVVVEDLEEEKRIEFHMHSNRSEMDGVSSVESLVSHAFMLGHEGVALTDHMVVQGFPKAQRTVENLVNKFNRPFKMVYGVEMNLVNKMVPIVKYPTDDQIHHIDYVVFDIETTGLSNNSDHIIEFAASIVRNDQIIDTMDILIKPPVSIPPFITNLTKIDDKLVENEKTFEEVIPQILDFIQDHPLVAHNGLFDFDFLNEELARIHYPALTNPLIDTLAMARLHIPGRRAYRLGALANYFKIDYRDSDAHRADYDVNILVEVFKRLKVIVSDKGIVTLNDLQMMQTPDAFMRQMKRHVCVLAKNQKGLKDLFKLVTISHTEQLAVLGKANSKSNGEEYLAEPRITKDVLAEYRSNLLIGSACYNGELFEIAANKSFDDLKEAMKFYDYIEIQPLENYRPLVEGNSITSVERLKVILKRLIKCAQELNLLLIATGDVHYVNPQDKFYRDIYINALGIGGSHHPLFIYDQTRRQNTDNPNQHFKTTKEMLDDFGWLEDDLLVHQLVIDSPKQLLSLIEETKPLHNDLKTPIIEGAPDKLRAICFETAHQKYGEDLPEIVHQRLERELNSIIGNGYSVVYYISHLLVMRSNEDGYLVGSRGSVGSSFAATMSGITEVNPLAPHYICPHCQHSIWIEDNSVTSGYDLPNKDCPLCNTPMKGDGQDIPFETFLGFEGDKVPDIDLNFSGDYQERAHLFTKEVFGEDFVYRAGTIGTVANKTAFGYIKGYCDEMNMDSMNSAYKEYLAGKCEGVKRTTGQHPGGIIVIPNYMDVYDFTPVQYPANNPESTWKTTHFDFHDIHDNVLKLDILGHVDPTVMKLLERISGIDVTSIPMNDEKAMSVFSSIHALNVDERYYNEVTGAVGLPEFGTRFVRGILELTKPKKFSELVSISGLSHGTDVWNNNAKDLVEQGHSLSEVIGCRDDIMTELIQYGLKPKEAFTIMESVRKGKGLKEDWEKLMKENHVPDWYIESCKKIKYMFPKAHAVAYVIMAVRIAWFKVHYPHYYYVAFFSLRCDAYEIESMTKDVATIAKRMSEIQTLIQNRQATNKDSKIYDTLEVCLEMISRGYRLSNIDIDKSEATSFKVDPNDEKVIIPPFTILDGLGENVAKSIVEEREKRSFLSKEDLVQRTLLSQTLLKKLDSLHALDHLDESNQLSLF